MKRVDASVKLTRAKPVGERKVLTIPPTDEWEFYVNEDRAWWQAGGFEVPCDCHGWIEAEVARPVLGQYDFSLCVDIYYGQVITWYCKDGILPVHATHWRPKRGPQLLHATRWRPRRGPIV